MRSYTFLLPGGMGLRVYSSPAYQTLGWDALRRYGPRLGDDFYSARHVADYAVVDRLPGGWSIKDLGRENSTWETLPGVTSRKQAWERMRSMIMARRFAEV